MVVVLALLVATEGVAAEMEAAEAPTRSTGLTVGLGGGWLAGTAYGGGFQQQLGLLVPIKRFSSLNIDFSHGRFGVTDAEGFFPYDSLPPTSITGHRDDFSLELGFLVGTDLYGGAYPEGVRVVPIIHAGLGLGFSSTSLQIPSFWGQIPFLSRSLTPLIGLGVGAEVHLRPGLALVPQVRAEAMPYMDKDETSGAEEWGLEWRIRSLLCLELGV